jgi:hypothetical protein
MTLTDRLTDLLKDWELAREAHARHAAMIKEHTGRTDTAAAGQAAMLGACIREVTQALALESPAADRQQEGADGVYREKP